MLILPIKKKWFDMIVSGEKKEEYREIKPYYDSRFMNAFGFILVGGQMVYGDAAPGEIRKPWPEWGAEPGKLYYVLKIQEVERRCAV